MFKIEFEVKRAKWLSNPNLRWKAGLEGAGLQFRQRLQRSNYGTAPAGDYPSTYQRTGTLANKAAFRIIEGGNIEMHFGSTFYLPYLWYGTGIYGYRGVPITPVSAPFLSWQGAGGQQIFARSVRGTIWPGHMEETVKQMEAGFKQGIKDYQE